VISEPESTSDQSGAPEGMSPPTSAETAPVAVPGAPPPPLHEAVEAGHELAAAASGETAAEQSAAEETVTEQESHEEPRGTWLLLHQSS